MIAFEWAVQEATADAFAAVLHDAGISVERRERDDAGDDTETFALLERAGLAFDQQARENPRPNRVLLVGRAAPAELATAIFRVASDASLGGVLIDVASDPVQCTEVRGVNGPVVVLADDDGARQLTLGLDAIGAALERAHA